MGQLLRFGARGRGAGRVSRLTRVPHRSAAMRREAVAVDPDDVDVAGAQRDPLLDQLRAGVGEGARAARDDLVVGDVSVLRDPGLLRELRDQLLDGGIRDRLPALTDGLVVGEESRAALLAKTSPLDELRD